MKILILIALCVFTSTAYSAGGVGSEGGAERENLAKIVGELDYLTQRLDAYARQASGPSGRSGRYSFDYRSLVTDIRAMRGGIVEYIDRDLSLARKILPLRTEYVIDMSKGGR